MGDVTRALREPHPLALLDLASSMLAVFDPRDVNPFERPHDDPDALTRDGLVGSFLEIDQPETSGLLAVIATMSTDTDERARISR